MNADTLKAEGWTALVTGGFTGAVGPMWTRGQDAAREVGIVIDDRHGNHIGTAHGGLLMTLADNALGYAVMEASGQLATATVQLQIQFVAAAKMGEFVTCRPEIIRRAKTLIFLRGLLMVGERTVASADGIWKLLEPKAG
jgi:uncharacterized protein (TIGR00369 family)